MKDVSSKAYNHSADSGEASFADNLAFADPFTRSVIDQILNRLDSLEEEVADLREENGALKKEVSDLKEDLRSLGVWRAPQKVDDLWEWVEDLDKTIQRIPATPASQKTAGATEEHQNHVKALLLREPNHRCTIRYIAPRLGVTRQQAWNIVRVMERERAVNVINDPHHKQRKIIELHQQIGTCSGY